MEGLTASIMMYLCDADVDQRLRRLDLVTGTLRGQPIVAQTAAIQPPTSGQLHVLRELEELVALRNSETC
jgi:hypothetical protein